MRRSVAFILQKGEGTPERESDGVWFYVLREGRGGVGIYLHTSSSLRSSVKRRGEERFRVEEGKGNGRLLISFTTSSSGSKRGRRVKKGIGGREGRKKGGKDLGLFQPFPPMTKG